MSYWFVFLPPVTVRVPLLPHQPAFAYLEKAS
jgi:hypothetical protein